MQLRPYQQEAVQAVYDYLRRHDDNPCVVAPTAAGKSWIIAQIATDAVTRWDGRVLILAHVKELLEQNADKVRRLCQIPIGIYSAGLRRRDTEHPVIVAGIQSIYKRACEEARTSENSSLPLMWANPRRKVERMVLPLGLWSNHRSTRLKVNSNRW